MVSVRGVLPKMVAMVPPFCTESRGSGSMNCGMALPAMGTCGFGAAWAPAARQSAAAILNGDDIRDSKGETISRARRDCIRDAMSAAEEGRDPTCDLPSGRAAAARFAPVRSTLRRPCAGFGAKCGLFLDSRRARAMHADPSMELRITFPGRKRVN